jgi:hypothetical protein
MFRQLEIRVGDGGWRNSLIPWWIFGYLIIMDRILVE